MGLPSPLLRGEDRAFQARWTDALAGVPLEERAIKQQIMDTCIDIERKISAIQTDVRDCNVIMARTVGRCIHFEMTRYD